MPLRMCETCKRTFKVKSSYDNHLRRKNKCFPPVIVNTVNNNLSNAPKSSDISSNINIPKKDSSISIDNNEDNCNNEDNGNKEDDKKKPNIENEPIKKVRVTRKKKSDEPQDISCPHCKDTFYKKSNLKRHLDRNVCQKNDDVSALDKLISDFNAFKKESEENKKILELIKEENMDLKKRLSESVAKDNIINNNTNDNSEHNTVNNINNIGNINNVNNVIVISNYGDEQMDKIDTRKIIECLKSGFNSTIKLTEVVHFDPDHPENHNVYIPNLKNKHAMVYRDGKWNAVIGGNFIEGFYQRKRDYIEENMEDYTDKLSQSNKNALKRWLDIDDNDERIKNIKTELYLKLFNNRNIPLETKKKQIKKLN